MLPGDRVQLVGARLSINGGQVPREEAAEAKTRNGFGEEVEVPTYVEMLPAA